MEDEDAFTLKVWKWVWRVGVQVFYFVVVFSVFEDLTQRTEILLMGLGGIIYVAVTSGVASLRYTVTWQVFVVRRQIAALAGKMGLEEFDAEAWKGEESAFNEQAKPMLVSVIGSSVISLYCLYKIFSSL